MKTPTTSSTCEPTETCHEKIRRQEPTLWVRIAPTGVLGAVLKAHRREDPLTETGVPESILEAVEAEYNDRL